MTYNPIIGHNPLDTHLRQGLRDAQNTLLHRGWTQGAMARDRSERPCRIFSIKAQSFSAMGAIAKQGYIEPIYRKMVKLCNMALDQLGYPTMTLDRWNNQSVRNKFEVVSLFDKAIEILNSMGDDLSSLKGEEEP